MKERGCRLLYIFLCYLTLTMPSHLIALDDALIAIEEEVNFQSIKNVLKNDFLKKEVIKKKKKARRIKKEKTQQLKALFRYPGEEDFWPLFSELWLTRNIAKLKWDFKKPDYGLEKPITKLFEKFGFFEKRFKLLLLNDSNITHFSLPSKQGVSIFLISLPFIRSIDLTKREIAVMIMEDYIRLQMGYFQDYVKSKDLKKSLGGNFMGKKLNDSLLKNALKRADHFIFKKGFSFQQQFHVTKKMSALLKTDEELWNAYLSLLKKVDALVKTNNRYKDYTKIYPSPEIQMKWILPARKIL